MENLYHVQRVIQTLVVLVLMDLHNVVIVREVVKATLFVLILQLVHHQVHHHQVVVSLHLFVMHLVLSVPVEIILHQIVLPLDHLNHVQDLHFNVALHLVTQDSKIVVVPFFLSVYLFPIHQVHHHQVDVYQLQYVNQRDQSVPVIIH